MKPLTPQEVLALPALVNVKMAAGALHLSERVVYEQVQRDDFIIEPLRFNRLIRFRRTDILYALGIEDYPHEARPDIPAAPSSAEHPHRLKIAS